MAARAFSLFCSSVFTNSTRDLISFVFIVRYLNAYACDVHGITNVKQNPQVFAHSFDATYNSPAAYDQTGSFLLLMCRVGDPASHLVKGIASLHDWPSLSD